MSSSRRTRPLTSFVTALTALALVATGSIAASAAPEAAEPADATTDSYWPNWPPGSNWPAGQSHIIDIPEADYNGHLGALFSPDSTEFKFWGRPEAVANVQLYLFEEHFPFNENATTADNMVADAAPDRDFLTNPTVPPIQMDFDPVTNVWSTTVEGNLDGWFYIYRITSSIPNDPRGDAVGGFQNRLGDGTRHTGVTGEFFQIDPWARATSANSHLSAVIDFSRTGTVSPLADRFQVDDPVDQMIVTLQIRDFSIHPSSGMENQGLYLAFTERGTSVNGEDRWATGIDHLIEMGVTTVHLMPTFDFRGGGLNEVGNLEFDSPGAMNWGYDPVNYSVPEGSFATDPTDPANRITEFKQMVSAMHEAGIRVVMDVVYNHTSASPVYPNFGVAGGHTFQDAISLFGGPFDYDMAYFYRWLNGDGTPFPTRRADGAACGNEVADNRPMVRKFVIDSLLHWQEEFGISGFRFDLMSLHYSETISMAAAALRENAVRLGRRAEDVIVYGEPWVAWHDMTGVAPQDRAGKGNQQNQGYANFNDNFRNYLIGHGTESANRGFITEGGVGREVGIMRGVRGWHMYEHGWTARPSETINYNTAHDNLSLWDRNMTAMNVQTFPPGTDNDSRKQGHPPFAAAPHDFPDTVWPGVVQAATEAQKLGLGIIMTSQGVPFFQWGDQFLRSKGGVRNSYDSNDTVNSLRWYTRERFADVADYVASIIEIRRLLPGFRYQDFVGGHDRIETIHEGESQREGLVAFRIHSNPTISVAFNGTTQERWANLGAGYILAENHEASVEGLTGVWNAGEWYRITPRSMTIVVDELLPIDTTLGTLSISESTAPLGVGEARALSLNAFTGFGRVMDVPAGATWASDDPSIATVDANGVVTAVATTGPRIVRITATVGGVSSYAWITVDAPRATEAPVLCEWPGLGHLLATDPLCVEPSQPVEPCPWPGLGHLDIDDVLCVEPTEPVMCEYYGLTHLPADDPLCVEPTQPVEPCPWPGLGHLDIDDALCVEPTEPVMCEYYGLTHLPADHPDCIYATGPVVCEPLTTRSFGDVVPGSQFHCYIEWMYEQEIAGGWADSTFRPRNVVTREQMATFLFRVAGGEDLLFTGPSTPTFRDKPSTSPFFTSVEWLAGENVTGGWPDGTFRPRVQVTREQMAAFLYRMAGSPAFDTPTTSSFSDVRVGTAFHHYIEWLADTGITAGWPDGTFRPRETVSREVMSAFLWRAVNSARVIPAG